MTVRLVSASIAPIPLGYIGNEAAMSVFRFQPRWKEELVCIGPGGQFVLDFPMGIPTVYLPTQHAWAQRAPAWARDLWPVLKTELDAWCEAGNAQLFLDGSAGVY